MKKFLEKMNALILEIEKQDRRARQATSSTTMNTSTKAIARPSIKKPNAYNVDIYRSRMGGMRV